jgi:hypothetical protein
MTSILQQALAASAGPHTAPFLRLKGGGAGAELSRALVTASVPPLLRDHMLPALLTRHPHLWYVYRCRCIGVQAYRCTGVQVCRCRVTTCCHMQVSRSHMLPALLTRHPHLWYVGVGM